MVGWWYRYASRRSDLLARTLRKFVLRHLLLSPLRMAWGVLRYVVGRELHCSLAERVVVSKCSA